MNNKPKKKDDDVIEAEVTDVVKAEPKPVKVEEDTWVPTPKQRLSMELFLDWTKNLKLNQIAERVGVKRMTLYRWRRDPRYKSYLKKLSNKQLREELPVVERALLRAADKGDVQAIKLYLEYMGRFREEMDINVSWGDTNDRR